MAILDAIRRWLERNSKREPTIDKEQLLADLQRPTPTVWDVLYERTGKPVFGKIAEFVRPQPEDVGGMSGPLALARLAKGAGKEIKALLSAIAKEGDPVGRSVEVDQILRESFTPNIVMPYGTIAYQPHQGIDRFAYNVVDALNKLPESALKHADVVFVAGEPVPYHIPGGGWVYPAGQYHGPATGRPLKEVTIYPNTPVRSIPQVLAHELTHAAVDQPTRQAYEDIINYLTDYANWPLTRTSTLAEAFPVDVRSQLPETLPRTYTQLANLYYKHGWPVKPLHPAPKPWGTRAEHHPIEDIAEAGSYALLSEVPKYRKTYAKGVEALERDPRVAIRRLLRLVNAIE